MPPCCAPRSIAPTSSTTPPAATGFLARARAVIGFLQRRARAWRNSHSEARTWTAASTLPPPRAPPRRSRSPSWPWAARAAACSPTGSSTWPSTPAGGRRPPRCRAWPSAPAPPSITWNCCPRPTSNAPAARPRWLMPTPGDVDLVVAAELMEGGRAIQRGLVTPDRSVLITSSHRSYAVSEKSAPGNGIADPNKVLEAGRAAAKRFMLRPAGPGRPRRQRHQRQPVRRGRRQRRPALLAR